MGDDYVSKREAELKAQYRAEMAWLGLIKLWGKLGKVLSLKREMDYYAGEYNAIRSQYVRRGRPAKAA